MDQSALEYQQSHVQTAQPKTAGTDHAFRPDIEGLRALAIALVVAFHAGVKWISGGYVGVDVFFVMSGYLITGILVREITRTNSLNFKEFYARRGRRLIPASMFMVLIVMILSSLRLTFIEEKGLWKVAAVTVLYGSNVAFMKFGLDYFDHASTATNVFLHTWSLAVEEQFYFVWPLLLLVVHRISRKRSAFAASLAVVSAASFALSLVLMRIGQPYAFFLLPSRFWEFGGGGLLAVLPSHSLRLSSTWSRIAGWAGAGLILAAAFGLRPDTAYPGVAVLLPFAGTLLVLLAGKDKVRGGVGQILSLAPFQYFGRLSYSIYLWHWPILVLWDLHDPSWQRAVLCVLATIAIAEFSHRFIENPIRFNPKLKQNAGLSLRWMVAVTACCLIAATAWWQIEQSRAQKNIYYRASQDDLKKTNPTCLAMQPDVAVTGCVLGDADSHTTVILLGDSHAWHWAPALDVAAKARGWRLLTLTKAACPPENIEHLWTDLLRHEYTECATWRSQAEQIVDQAKPAMLYIASDSDYRTGPRLDQGLTYKQWHDSFAALFHHLSDEGIPVTVIADVPSFPDNTPVCLARAQKFGVPCKPLETAFFNPIKDRAEADAVRSSSNAREVSMISLLCPDGVCQREENGIIMYTDFNHLTATYSRSLGQELNRKISLTDTHPAEQLGPVAQVRRSAAVKLLLPVSP